MKHKERIFIALIIGIIFLLGLMVNVSAITGKIGNARMVLNLESGDSIEKSILVINDNDVSLRIDINATGSLEENTKIIDNSFILKPGEEKKAIFNLKAGDVGKYESRINIKFTPIETNESGIVLSSVIILNVYDKGTLNGDSGNELNIINTIKEKFNGSYAILGMTTLILLIAVIILLYSAKKRSKRKGEKGGGFTNLKLNGTKT
jgi:hypothetical protein